MRDVNISQLIFLAFVILMPILEQVLKRRRQQGPPGVPPSAPPEIEPEFEIEDFQDAQQPVEERDEEPAIPARGPSRDEPAIPPPVRSYDDAVERAPIPSAPRAEVVIARAVAPPARPPARREPRITRSEARRALLLMEVLGPCVSMRSGPGAPRQPEGADAR